MNNIKPNVYQTKALITRKRRAQSDARLLALFAQRQAQRDAELDAMVAANKAAQLLDCEPLRRMMDDVAADMRRLSDAMYAAQEAK
jgi:hypothetical protein